MLDRKADKVWCYTGCEWLAAQYGCLHLISCRFVLLTMTTHSFFNLNCHINDFERQQHLGLVWSA